MEIRGNKQPYYRKSFISNENLCKSNSQEINNGKELHFFAKSAFHPSKCSGQNLNGFTNLKIK